MSVPGGKTRRFVSLLLTLCFLLTVFSAGAEVSWKNRETPYGAKLKEGTVFYSDSELTEELGTLQKEAVIEVLEIREKAARIRYTVKQKTGEAWVTGTELILLSVATPTDLDALIRGEDVILTAPPVPDEPVQPKEEEPVGGSAIDEPSADAALNEDPDLKQDKDAIEPFADIPAEIKDEAEEPAAEPLSDTEPEEPEEDTVYEELPVAETIGESETDVHFGSIEDTTMLDMITGEEAKQTAEKAEKAEKLDTGNNYVMTESGEMASPDYMTPDLPEVRNQNPYGTCWAFASIGGMEIDLIKSGASSDIDLSEFFLIYYAAHNYPYPKSGGEDDIASRGTAALTQGGNREIAMYFLSVLIGTTTEVDNPYDDAAGMTPGNMTDIAAQLTGAYRIDATDRDLIKQMIREHGAVGASVAMPDSSNTGRVYRRNDLYLYGEEESSNHSVLLVGWNDSLAVSYFDSRMQPPGPGAWKVRNSWGSYDGEDGYFWVSYYDKALTTHTMHAYDAVTGSSNVDDYCYTYAKVVPYYYTYEYGKATLIQSFTVDGGEQVRSVGVDVDTAGIRIAAAIRVNGKQVAYSRTYTADKEGFYRLPLTSPYYVGAKTQVEVEVTYQAKDQNTLIRIPYQNSGTNYFGSITYTGTVDSGGFTLNGSQVNGDSTIRLYTEQKSVGKLVQSVTLNQHAIDLQSCETARLSTTIAPSDATNKKLSWSSSNNNIAWIDGNGLVVGGTESGKAIITVMSSNGRFDTCEVNVTAREVQVESVKIASEYFSAGTAAYTLRTSKTGLKAGDTFELKAKMDPVYNTDSLSWSTSDSRVLSIVSVDRKKQTCTVRVRGNGTATITVQAKNSYGGIDAEFSIKLTMDLKIPVSRVILNYGSVKFYEGDFVALDATVLPTDATDKSVTWSSSNPKVASVSSFGTVRALKDGKTTITVTTNDGQKTASCEITVMTPDPVEAFVYRMYRICLLREPDETGFNLWVRQLRTHTLTGGQVAYNFFFSNEMINRKLSDSAYIDRAYQAIMGRGADSGGKKFWLERLQTGFSRAAIVCGFIQSNEFGRICSDYGITRGTVPLTEARDQNYGVTAFTSRLYTKMLGRNYDINGLNYWCSIILKQPTRATLLKVALEGFMHSNEFVNKKLSNTAFLKVLYRTFLGREAESGGMQFWLGKIYSGMSRDEVAAGFASSNEFRNIMSQFGFN